MRYFLTIFFLLGIGLVSADEKTMLYDFRYWTAPDHTRIVVDTQENAFYDIFTSKDYIILSVENAKVLSNTFSHLFFQDKRIQRTQIKRDHETLRLIFHTKDLYSVKYFNLPPKQKYKYHRLVIDLYDSKSSKSKTKVAIEKSTPSDKTIILVDAGHGGEDYEKKRKPEKKM
jgi:N-acetylmuramoyl-L-alanine amidase